MEITINGSPKEIADLVVALQGQLNKVDNHYSPKKLDQKSIYDLTTFFLTPP